MKTFYNITVQTSWLIITLVVVGLSAFEIVPSSNSTKLKLDCGGTIPIRGSGPKNSFLLSYTSVKGKKNGETCLWTLDTTHNSQRYNVKAMITLLDKPDDAHLSVLELKSTKDNKDLIIVPHELKQKKQIYKSKEWNHNLYLSYTSSGKVSASARYELRLLFTILETQTEDTGSNVGFVAGTGMHKYGVAGKEDKFSMIINLKKPEITLTLDTFTPNQNKSRCTGSDSLNIYEMELHNKPNHRFRLCKKLKNPRSFTSQHPLLVTFYPSARRNVDSEFQISWK